MQNPAEIAVLAANRGFYAAFRGRDIAAMERVWARTKPVACVHPGWDAIHGRDTVLESFRAILRTSGPPDIHASEESVLFLGETAVVTCIERVGSTDLAATNVFAFEEGAWKMVHHHASPASRDRLARAPSSTLN